MSKKKYTSSSLDRRLTTYLKHRQFMIFEAERYCLMRGESEHLKYIIDNHINTLTLNHQQYLLEIYDTKLKK